MTRDRDGYHSFTFGFLVGEIARRATGKPMRQLLHELVTVPLGIDGDLYFGVPRTDLARLARLEDAAPQPVAPPDGDGILAPWELQPTAAMGNSHEILQADIPSVGTFTARGIAAMNAAVLDGRLIDSHKIEELTAVAFEGTDQVFGNHARLALGYPLGRIDTRPDDAPTTFGWVGGGGSAQRATVVCARPHVHDQSTASSRWALLPNGLRRQTSRCCLCRCITTNSKCRLSVGTDLWLAD